MLRIRIDTLCKGLLMLHQGNLHEALLALLLLRLFFKDNKTPQLQNKTNRPTQKKYRAVIFPFSNFYNKVII